MPSFTCVATAWVPWSLFLLQQAQFTSVRKGPRTVVPKGQRQKLQNFLGPGSRIYTILPCLIGKVQQQTQPKFKVWRNYFLGQFYHRHVFACYIRRVHKEFLLFVFYNVTINSELKIPSHCFWRNRVCSYKPLAENHRNLSALQPRVTSI